MGKSELKQLFANQLLKAYEGWQKQDIAADLKISPSRLSKILTASQDVDAELVISVSEKRGCSTDWLLKGEGGGPVSILDILEETTRAAVEGLAAIEDRDEELLIAELVRDALVARGAEMFRHILSLRPTEIRKLKILLRLAGIDVDAADAQQPARTNVR